MKFIDLNKKIWQWIVLIFLATLWGSSFILMKRGMESFSHYQVAAFRIFITFVLFIPFIYRNIKDLNRKTIKSIFIVGSFGNAIPAFLFTAAQTEISSSLAGILNSLVPISTLVLGLVMYRAKTTFLNILGLIIGLIGAAGIISKDYTTFFIGNNWYSLLAILATIMYGYSINEIKYKLKNIGGVAISSLAFLTVGPFAGIYLLFSDFSGVITTPNWKFNLFYVVILAISSSFIAVTVMNILLKYVSAIFVSSVTYIIPIIAICWGLIDGETLNIIDFIWMVIILTGVYLINKKGNEAKKGN